MKKRRATDSKESGAKSEGGWELRVGGGGAALGLARRQKKIIQIQKEEIKWAKKDNDKRK